MRHALLQRSLFTQPSSKQRQSFSISGWRKYLNKIAYKAFPSVKWLTISWRVEHRYILTPSWKSISDELKLRTECKRKGIPNQEGSRPLCFKEQLYSTGCWGWCHACYVGCGFWFDVGKQGWSMLEKCWTEQNHYLMHWRVEQKQYGVNPMVLKFNGYSQKLITGCLASYRFWKHVFSAHAVTSFGVSLRWHVTGGQSDYPASNSVWRDKLLLPIKSFTLRSILRQHILQNLLCWEWWAAVCLLPVWLPILGLFIAGLQPQY